MSYPSELHVVEHPPAGGWSASGPGTVVLVHGTLDRAGSFNRVVRRLRDQAPELGIVVYDRRGYGGSRPVASPAGFDEHVADLVGVATGVPGAGPVVAVGHSLGGTIVLGAAASEPTLFRAVGAFEPPLPWFGFRRPRSRPPSWAAPDADPAEEAERFFRRMVSDGAWERLPERIRRERREEGPALLADFRSFGRSAPFELSAVKVPVVFARGGPESQPHHRQGTAWAARELAGARLFEIEGAAHGAHLTHPGAFADFVLAVVAATPEGGDGETAAVRP